MTTISRRDILGCLAAISLAPARLRAEALLPPTKTFLVGAIRWDAWYAPGSQVTQAVERSLSPPQYRWRLPFFAQQIEDRRVALPKMSQALMDLEIHQAAYAGLDYWAFVAYKPENPLSIALKYYLASPYRRRVRFCMYTALEYWGSSAQPSAIIDEHIGLMKDEAYVRVEDGRPLYFLGFITPQKMERWGGISGLCSKINAFRARAQATGLGNPYFVVEGSWPSIGLWAKQLGGDAVGSYAITDGRRTGDYAALTRIVEAGWNKLAESGLPVLSTAMVGWDRRPRVENPGPWENSPLPFSDTKYYFVQPTPSQFAAHLRRAIAWQNERLPQKRSPAILIYAWNEYDEGGWLSPTSPCHTERLVALHELLSQHVADPNPGCRFSQ
jgi:hypothetical protein